MKRGLKARYVVMKKMLTGDKKINKQNNFFTMPENSKNDLNGL